MVVLNGTSTSGLAGKEATKLEAKNFNIETTDDADREDYTTTQIIDMSEGKKSSTLAALKKTYAGASVGSVNSLSSNYGDADFIIIVGADRIPKTTQN